MATCQSSVELVRHLSTVLISESHVSEECARTSEVRELTARYDNLVSQARAREQRIRESKWVILNGCGVHIHAYACVHSLLDNNSVWWFRVSCHPCCRAVLWPLYLLACVTVITVFWKHCPLGTTFVKFFSFHDTHTAVVYRYVKRDWLIFLKSNYKIVTNTVGLIFFKTKMSSVRAGWHCCTDRKCCSHFVVTLPVLSCLKLLIDCVLVWDLYCYQFPFSAWFFM
jgi:hypothetical protein